MKKLDLQNNYYIPLAAAWAALVMPTLAFAQSSIPPQEYTVKLTAPEVDIVGKALGSLPYQEVALLIQKLREQIVAQQQNKPVDEKK